MGEPLYYCDSAAQEQTAVHPFEAQPDVEQAEPVWLRRIAAGTPECGFAHWTRGPRVV